MSLGTTIGLFVWWALIDALLSPDTLYEEGSKREKSDTGGDDYQYFGMATEPGEALAEEMRRYVPARAS